jgi:hypothetical protein
MGIVFVSKNGYPNGYPYYIIRIQIISKEQLNSIMETHKILIDVDKFKEILIHSWHLLPPEKQQELASIGIFPKNPTPIF